MTFGEVYMEYCEQGMTESIFHDKENKTAYGKIILKKNSVSRYVDSISVAEVNDYLSFLYYTEDA